MADTLSAEEWEFWDAWMRAQRLLTRELDRSLQDHCGISKAEFSVLVTLSRAPGHEMRVGELTESLDWEKSRVSHMLTRMENRGFVARTEFGATGRRTAVGLTTKGSRAARSAIRHHAGNIRRYVLDPITPEQTATIRAWSEQLINRIDPNGDG
ncbi:winged helix-turn-helix transcriptional regulator [Amycolatopsis acidicola]|uniref:Winged helix-turn-helix transcriptional regulator n=1 Tax=Amycolatopsis acidicola TaxID=2596893 RepID=A0A5N0UYS2_9PSEU|nr:MarR family winged helix-turn-helix transcriptional regulator [Amycolatopsis acidicola]KAA9156668.1 winged helix-turn-helix transcriptional regulator [Amycolatopsis acidicola]